MRILDDEANRKLDNVSIFLTKEEAIQLRSYLDQLLSNPELQHLHLSSADYQKEVTVSIYNENNLSGFNERVKNLILNDE